LKLEQLCVILLLGENTKKMSYTPSLLKITEDQNEYARMVSSKMSHPLERKRGMIDILGITSAVNWLLVNKIKVQVARSLHKVPKLLEEFKITDNSMLLTHLYSEVLKEFEDNHLIIKMNSPLIARNHDRQTNKNKYYLATDSEFKETIKINISNVIERLNLDLSLEDFEINPLKGKSIEKRENEIIKEVTIHSFIVSPVLPREDIYDFFRTPWCRNL